MSRRLLYGMGHGALAAVGPDPSGPLFNNESQQITRGFGPRAVVVGTFGQADRLGVTGPMHQPVFGQRAAIARTVGDAGVTLLFCRHALLHSWAGCSTAAITCSPLRGCTLMGYFEIDPIKALVWNAIANGVISVPIMAALMLTGQEKRLMGKYTISLRHRFFGWSATLVMAVA